MAGYTFEFYMPEKTIKGVERLASTVERVGENASEAEKRLAAAFDEAVFSGAAKQFTKIAQAQGEWETLSKKAAKTQAQLLASFKQSNSELVRLTESIDRATAAEKAQIEVNRHKIKETLKYEVALKKLRQSNRLFDAQQERSVELQKELLAQKKKLAQADLALNPSKTIKQLKEQNAVDQAKIKINDELMQSKAQLRAMEDSITASRALEAQQKKIQLTQMREEVSALARLNAAKEGAIKLSQKETKALMLVRREHISYAEATRRVSEQMKQLSIREKISADQKKRLAVAEAKNSAEFLRTEKVIAELESRYRRATQTISHFNAVQSKGGILVSTFRNVMDGMGRHIAVYTAGMVGVAAATYGATRAIRAGFAAFDGYTEAIARANAVSQATPAQLKAMEEEARRLGRTTRFSAVEAAEGLVQLTMAGLTTYEAVQALGPTMQLASIGAMQFGEAADIVTNLMRGFALQATDLPHVIDVMATSVTSANMTVQQMGNSMSYVAPVAESFGVSLEAVAASMEVLHNSGIKGSRAGTGMRKTLLSLYAPAKKAAEVLEKAGVSTSTLTGKAKPLIQILEDLNKAVKAGKVSFADLKDVVGVRASNSFLQLVKAADGTETSLAALEARLHSATGAADEMRVKIEDFIGADWEKLKDAFIDIGLGLLKLYETPIRDWLQGVTEGISAFAGSEDGIQAIADALAEMGHWVAFAGKAFLTYKLAQTVYILGINSIETAKYIATIGTRLLETAGLVRGWSAAVIEGNVGIAASSLETSTIVDASGKKIVMSNANVATSAGIAGAAFKKMATGIVAASKWMGKMILGTGVVGAALWALSEVVGFLFGQFSDMSDLMDEDSGAFDRLSGSIRQAKDEMAQYSAEAARMLDGQDSDQIDRVSRALKTQAESRKALKREQTSYQHLLSTLNSLESQEQILLAGSTEADKVRAKIVRDRITQTQLLIDKSKNAQDTLKGDFTNSSLRILDEQILSTTNHLDRLEKQLVHLGKLGARDQGSGTILGDAWNGVQKRIAAATEKLNEFIDARAKLQAGGPAEETTTISSNLITDAKKAQETVRSILQEVRSGGASASAEVQKVLKGLADLANGKLPDGVTTANGAKLWLTEAMKGFTSTAKAAYTEQQKAIESNRRHAETMAKLADEQARLTQIKNKDLSVSERYQNVENSLRETLAQIEALEKKGIAQGHLSAAQKKKLETLARKYNKSLKDEAAILKEVEKQQKKHDDELKKMLKIASPVASLVEEYGKKLALLKELLDTGRISQAEFNKTLEKFNKEMREASATTEFEKKLVEYEDLIGNLDKASAGWIDSFTDSLAGFLRTGKADFSSFVNSILDDLAKLAAQQIVISIVGDIKGITGGGSLGGGGSIFDLVGGLFKGGSEQGPGSSMFGGLGNMLSVGKSVWSGISGFLGLGGAASVIPVAASAPAAGMAGWLGYSGGAALADAAGGAALGASGAAGMVGAETTGLGLMGTIGAAIPYVAIALAVLAAIGAFDDQEAASRFKLQPGKQPDFTNTKRPWTGTDFGAVQHGKQGELMGVVVNSVFGNMGASGQHFGKDEQLSDEDLAKYIKAMQDVFIQLSKIDSAIVDTYDLSDEAVARIKEAANGMDDVIKKWKTPDMGKYVIERYNIVFEEIGGTVEKIFHDMTQSGLDAEHAIRALTAAFNFDSVLRNLLTVKEDADSIMEDAQRTQMEKLKEQRDAVYDLIQEYDGSIQSVENLTQAMEAQRQGTISLLIEIEKVRAQMESAFASTREKIETSLMNDAQKYTYYQTQLDQWAGVLANSTDKDQINEALAKINELTNKLWDLQVAAGPNAAGKTQQEWLDYLAEQERVGNEQLDKAAEEAAKEAENLSNAIAQAINDAVIPMKESADTTSDAADTMNNAALDMLRAAGVISEAGDTMNYAASTIAGTTITIDLSGGEGFSVGT